MEGGFFTLVSTFFKLFFIHVLWIRNFVVCLHHRNDAVPNKHHKIMKTTIFAKTKTNGLGIENGNAVSVELNRYAKGHWPVDEFNIITGHTHEYELLINGKWAFRFNKSLSKAKQFAEKTLMTEWIAVNPW